MARRRCALTLSNVGSVYPGADIRPIYGGVKHRWADVLASGSRERAERVLLMAYHAQPVDVLRQPRLLWQGKVVLA